MLQKEQVTNEAKIIQINAGSVVRPKRGNIGSWIRVYSVSRTAFVEVKWMLYNMQMQVPILFILYENLITNSELQF